MKFLFVEQASSTNDRDVLDDFPDEANGTTPVNPNKCRAIHRSSSRASSLSPAPSYSSKSGDRMNLKAMAVDALRSIGQVQQKDKFGALGDYIAAELRSLTVSQAEYARSKISRAFNDIVDEAIQKVRTIFLNIQINSSKFA